MCYKMHFLKLAYFEIDPPVWEVHIMYIPQGVDGV